MVDDNKESGQDAFSLGKEIRTHKWLLIKNCSLAAILAVIVVLSIPNEYGAEVKIADESKEVDLAIGLNNISSMIKQALPTNIGMNKPNVYSLLIQSESFAKMISKIRINKYGMDYYHYIYHHHKTPWWTSFTEGSMSKLNGNDLNEDILNIIKDNIRYEASDKYSTITIQVIDNDPDVAAIVVDSVRILLQQELTKYKVDKAKIDLANALKVRKQTGDDYNKAKMAYAAYYDSHQDPSESEGVLLKSLTDERDRTFNLYDKACQQYIRDVALTQKITPSFAVLKNSTVPRKSYSPTSFAYIISYIFISFILTLWWILFRKSNSRKKGQ